MLVGKSRACTGLYLSRCNDWSPLLSDFPVAPFPSFRLAVRGEGGPVLCGAFGARYSSAEWRAAAYAINLYLVSALLVICSITGCRLLRCAGPAFVALALLAPREWCGRVGALLPLPLASRSKPQASAEAPGGG